MLGINDLILKQIINKETGNTKEKSLVAEEFLSVLGKELQESKVDDEFIKSSFINCDNSTKGNKLDNTSTKEVSVANEALRYMRSLYSEEIASESIFIKASINRKSFSTERTGNGVTDVCNTVDEKNKITFEKVLKSSTSNVELANNDIQLSQIKSAEVSIEAEDKTDDMKELISVLLQNNNLLFNSNIASENGEVGTSKPDREVKVASVDNNKILNTSSQGNKLAKNDSKIIEPKEMVVTNDLFMDSQLTSEKVEVLSLNRLANQLDTTKGELSRELTEVFSKVKNISSENTQDRKGTAPLLVKRSEGSQLDEKNRDSKDENYISNVNNSTLYNSKTLEIKDTSVDNKVILNTLLQSNELSKNSVKDITPDEMVEISDLFMDSQLTSEEVEALSLKQQATPLGTTREELPRALKEVFSESKNILSESPKYGKETTPPFVNKGEGTQLDENNRVSKGESYISNVNNSTLYNRKTPEIKDTSVDNKEILNMLLQRNELAKYGIKDIAPDEMVEISDLFMDSQLSSEKVEVLSLKQQATLLGTSREELPRDLTEAFSKVKNISSENTKDRKETKSEVAQLDENNRANTEESYISNVDNSTLNNSKTLEIKGTSVDNKEILSTLLQSKKVAENDVNGITSDGIIGINDIFMDSQLTSEKVETTSLKPHAKNLETIKEEIPGILTEILSKAQKKIESIKKKQEPSKLVVQSTDLFIDSQLVSEKDKVSIGKIQTENLEIDKKELPKVLTEILSKEQKNTLPENVRVKQSFDQLTSDSSEDAKLTEISVKEEKILGNIINHDNKMESKFAGISLHLNRMKENIVTQEKLNEITTVNKNTMINDVIKVIKHMDKVDVKELVVKVNPENLGELTIKVIMEGSELKANISASNKDTYSLLSSNAADIKNGLNASMVKINDVSINVYNDDVTFSSNLFSGNNQQSKEHDRKSPHQTVQVSDEVDNQDLKLKHYPGDSNLSVLA